MAATEVKVIVLMVLTMILLKVIVLKVIVLKVVVIATVACYAGVFSTHQAVFYANDFVN